MESGSKWSENPPEWTGKPVKIIQEAEQANVMLMGTFQHNIDKKGRVFIPAKMRSDLGERFVISYSVERKKCLAVYSMDGWNNLVYSIAKGMGMDKAKTYFRYLCSSASEAECDAQGRVLIPQKLREYAGLGDTALIVGVSDSVEIWTQENWDRERASFEEENLEGLLSGISMLGHE